MPEQLQAGDRVFITDREHPWAGHSGELIAEEQFGLGWLRWRIKLDDGKEISATRQQLQGPGRVAPLTPILPRSTFTKRKREKKRA